MSRRAVSPQGTPNMIERQRRHGAAGFSLIEVMVATGVLLVVVLMVGAVFRQASSSWDGGYARAEGGMIVRGVLGAIQRDLSQAVDGRRFLEDWDVPVKVSGGEVQFVRPYFDQETKEEQYHLVTYTAGAGSVKRKWQLLKWNNTDKTWSVGGGGDEAEIYTDGKGMRPGYGFRARFEIAGDEVTDPGVGLDPDGTNRMLELIVSLRRERGMTVMLSSHQLEQVQRICTRVGIMIKGKLAALGSLDELSKGGVGDKAGPNLEEIYMRYFKEA